MCGRYGLTLSAEELADWFDLSGVPVEHQPRFNIAPTQNAPILVAAPEGLRFGQVRWGLIPWWAKDPAIGNRHINARSETAAKRPAFRDAFARRRCLVPADGFYEWRKDEQGKTPIWIRARSGAPLTLAGLWDRWRPKEGEGEPVVSFTILTRSAAAGLRKVHERMPVILSDRGRTVWLDGNADNAALGSALQGTVEGLVGRPVSKHVNKPEHDDPTCLDPVGPEFDLD